VEHYQAKHLSFYVKNDKIEEPLVWIFLSLIEEPFSSQEIDDVVAEFPNNKSPGQMGLTLNF